MKKGSFSCFHYECLSLLLRCLWSILISLSRELRKVSIMHVIITAVSFGSFFMSVFSTLACERLTGAINPFTRLRPTKQDNNYGLSSQSISSEKYRSFVSRLFKTSNSLILSFLTILVCNTLLCKLLTDLCRILFNNKDLNIINRINHSIADHHLFV